MVALLTLEEQTVLVLLDQEKEAQATKDQLAKKPVPEFFLFAYCKCNSFVHRPLSE